MSILAKNLVTIRKELRCTQSAMAEILKVGFRTYVRYEAGERDAPVSVLVKVAKLANMSLELMLTTEVGAEDIVPLQAIDFQAPPPEVKKCDFRTGQIEFKKPSVRGLLVSDERERKLVGFFRKMDLATQKTCLDSVKKAGKGSKGKGEPKKIGKADKPKKVAVRREPSVMVQVKAPQVRRKGKPGRRKLDKKVLKEKIDKLKMLTKSINKITVR